MTDTDKWKKPFIRSMPTPYKLLWIYILDDCDHAGIWQVDFDVAQIKIGEKLNCADARKYFGDKIQVINGGEKWYIKDFVFFQYGILNPANRMHLSVIHIHSKYQIPLIRPLTDPMYGAKDIDIDKDKEKDKDKDRVVLPFENPEFIEIWGIWKKYKSEQFKFKYKSATTEQAALKNLLELSKGNQKTANEIILQSIQNGWKGFFELKKNGKQTSTHSGFADAMAERIREKRGS